MKFVYRLEIDFRKKKPGLTFFLLAFSLLIFLLGLPSSVQ